MSLAATTNKKDFYFFYLPLVVIINPVATKKTSKFEVRNLEYYFSFLPNN